MNDDQYGELHPWIEPEMEARLVALVLGEASDFEADELRRLMEERPELRVFKERLESVHGLLGAAVKPVDDEEWRLSPERRGEVLDVFGVDVEESVLPAVGGGREVRIRKQAKRVAMMVAACFMVAVLLTPLIFRSLQSSITAKSERDHASHSRELATSMKKSEAARGERLWEAPPGAESPGRSFGSGGEAKVRGYFGREQAGEVNGGEANGDALADQRDASEALAPLRRSLGLARGAARDEAAAGRRPESLSVRGQLFSSGGAVGDVAVDPPLPPVPAASVQTRTMAKKHGASAMGRAGGGGAATTPLAAPIVPASPSGAGAELAEKVTADHGADPFGDAGPDDFAVGYDVTEAALMEEESLLGEGSVGQKAGVRFAERKSANQDGLGAAAPDGMIHVEPNVVNIDGFFDSTPAPPGKAESRKFRVLDLVAGQLTEENRRDDHERGGFEGVESKEGQGWMGKAMTAAKEEQSAVADEEDLLKRRKLNEAEPLLLELGGSRLSAERASGEVKELEIEKESATTNPAVVADKLAVLADLDAEMYENTDEYSSPMGVGGVQLRDRSVDRVLESLIDEADGDAVDGLEIRESEGQSRGVRLRREEGAQNATFGLAREREEVRKKAELREMEKSAAAEAFSTFSLHVSDVSFKLAQAALAKGEWPEGERVRVEEFVNAFDYGDPSPAPGEKVSCQVEQAVHPFMQQRNVMRIAMRTAAAGRASGTPLRLTILLDNSGSMERADRAEAVRSAFALLVDQLTPEDEVTLISFARTPRLLKDGVSGDKAGELLRTIEETPSEGGTNLEEALRLGMEKATEHRLEGAQNRLILLTDGAANLGDAEPERLKGLVETLRQRGIAFDACGVGADGLNDDILEALTRKGDGRYYFLDRAEDADEGFAKQIAGALRPAAKNVKVQVEFNPKRVGHYALYGFEKHELKKEDFRNDRVDAAELAAEEAGVAMYHFETLPEGKGDVGTVSVRFQDMATGEMVEKVWPIPYEVNPAALDGAAPSMKLAASAAFLGESLKGSAVGASVDLGTLAEVTRSLQTVYPESERIGHLIEMVEKVREMK